MGLLLLVLVMMMMHIPLQMLLFFSSFYLLLLLLLLPLRTENINILLLLLLWSSPFLKTRQSLGNPLQLRFASVLMSLVPEPLVGKSSLPRDTWQV